MKDGDLAARGDLPNEYHVMLDHDDRVMTREREQQVPRAVRLFIRHAGRRFVHQEKLRVLREQHANFEPLLLSVGQRAGLRVRLIAEVDRLQDIVNAVLLRAVWAMEEAVPDTAAPFPLLRKRFSKTL